MEFHDIRFPTDLSFGALGGPERRTEIVTLASGFEERNTPWAHSRRRYDVGVGLRSLDDIEVLIAFFEARRGPLYGFRWKDWADFRSCLPSREVTADDQILGHGDEIQTSFQLIKTYASGTASYARPISKPVDGTVRVAVSGEELVQGIDWDVDVSTGIITFTHPPDLQAEVTAGYEFDVPVRFATDRLQASMATYQAGEMPDVQAVEIRV